MAGEQSGIAGAERKRFCDVRKMDIFLIMAVDNRSPARNSRGEWSPQEAVQKGVCCAVFLQCRGSSS